MHLIVKEQVGCNRAKSPTFILPLDVRAKQRLSYQPFLVNSNGYSGGFAPRHPKRYAHADTFP